MNRRRAKPSFRNSNARTVDTLTPEVPVGSEISDGWLTQFGTDVFREEPRWAIEMDVSTLLGQLSVEETVRAAFGRPPKPHHRRRWFRVARLTENAYRCIDTGHRKNPIHASIVAGCPGDDIEIHRAWWANPGRVTLEALAELERAEEGGCGSRP